MTVRCQINLQSYSVPERCFVPPLEITEKVELPPKPGFVITSEDVHAISGAVCSATISRFRGYCRAYWHWKFMDVPEVEASREVSVEECRKAYTQHTFEASNGKLLRVEPGESVLYQYVEDGSITVLWYNTFCQGVKLQLHHSQIADESLVLDGSLAYTFDKSTLSCPFKRVRTVQLQQDQDNKLLIDAQLGLLFNTMGTKKLEVEGCPSLSLIYTTYEGIMLTMDIKAKQLDLVKGLNVHEVNSLGPTLEFFHHTNHHLVQSLIRQKLEGDCEAWLRISNMCDHPHPTLKRRGLFTRRVGSLIQEYSCKNVQAPMVEINYCLTGIPILLRGELHMIDPDSRVITKHLETQPCEQGFPMTFQTAGDAKIWVQVSHEILQVKDPNPLHERIEYQENEHMSTLYTSEELNDWGQFSSFSSVQRSRTQKILNSLCVGELCSSAGSSQVYEKFDLEELTSQAEKTGKEILAKMNRLGFVNIYWQGFKDSAVHLLMLEYLAIIVCSCISVCRFGIAPAVAALVNRLTIDWGRLQTKKRPVPEVRMQRLLNAEENI